MRCLAAGLAGALLSVSPLYAADLLGSAPPPMDEPAYQTELGSNWYIRGDVGYSVINQATVVPEDGLFPTIGNMPIGDASNPVAATRGNNKSVWTPDFSAAIGYRINDWFRAEASWTYSKGPGFSAQATAFCPEIATAVPTGAQITVGYQYDYTTCNGRLNVSQYNNTGLVMGYADLGHYGIFTPYIGGGAGVNVNSMTGTLKWNQTDNGQTYAGSTIVGTAPAVWVTPTGTLDSSGNPNYQYLPGAQHPSGQPQPIGPSNWYRTINATKYSFAVAAAAGLGIKISQSATLDLGYKITTLDVTNGVKGLLQSANIGVRYNIN